MKTTILDILRYTFFFLIFPGFLFSVTMGLMAGWVDRKVTARVQWRVGPPWYQNFVDILKLMLYKETLVPSGVSKILFLGMPVVSAAAAAAISTITLLVNAVPAKSFTGDLVLVTVLTMIPPMTLVASGLLSKNSLASLGASREKKLMHSYELPFILAIAVPVIKSGYKISLAGILAYQQNAAPVIGTISGSIAFAVMLLCVQAKLGYTPFDISEAETEIVSGPYIEYSGKGLGVFKLAKAVLTFALPVFMMTLFFGGIRFGLGGLAKAAGIYVLILAVMVVIKNTNPRVRIDHAEKFFRMPVTPLAAIAAVLAFFGR